MRLTRDHLALIALLTVGCSNPEDPIFVYGRALQPDGTPLEKTVLTYEWRKYLVDPFSKEPRAFRPYGTSTTQPNGDFTLELLWEDVMSTNTNLPLGSSEGSATVVDFRLALPLQKDGQGSFITFTFFNGDIEIPVLRPWDAQFTVVEGPQGPRLNFAPAPPVPELPPSARDREITIELEGGKYESLEIPTLKPEPIVQLFSGGERLWRQTGMSSPWEPGPYVLEDFTAPQAQLRTVSLGQWSFNPLASFTSAEVHFRQEWRTARQPLPAGTLRPVSRDASCYPAPEGACPWTDGQLASVEIPKLDGSVNSLVFTLAAPTPLRRAVIRGLSYWSSCFGGSERLRLRVEGSMDGEHWLPLGDAVVRERTDRQWLLDHAYTFLTKHTAWDSPFDEKLELFDEVPLYLDLPLTSPEPVRQVQVQLSCKGIILLNALSELSLFAE